MVVVVEAPGLPLAKLMRGPGLKAGLEAPPPTLSLPLGLWVVEETSDETEEAAAESSSGFSSAGAAVVLVRLLDPLKGSLGRGLKLGAAVLL